jgi:hypothetical protein
MPTGAGGTTNKYNFLVKAFRFGRVYKIIKLLRLVKLLKVCKNREKLTEQTQSKMKLSGGLIRLILVSCMFFFMAHLFACLWIIFSIDEISNDSWMNVDVMNLPPNELYLMSIYFVITTMTTVGYGDISAGTMQE